MLIVSSIHKIVGFFVWFTEKRHRQSLPQPGGQENRLCLDELAQRARAGAGADVDWLMELLEPDAPFVHLKMVDYVLGLVSSQEGRERIHFHLFFGSSQMRRNYAALYFKRRNERYVLAEAVRRGAIDSIQAYCR